MANQRHHWIGRAKHRRCEHCGLQTMISLRAPHAWQKFYKMHGDTKWVRGDHVPPCLPKLKTWRDKWDAMRDEAATHNRSNKCTSGIQ